MTVFDVVVVVLAVGLFIYLCICFKPFCFILEL